MRLLDSRHFVRDWFDYNNITITPTGDTIDPKRGFDKGMLHKAMLLDYDELLNAHNMIAEKKIRPVGLLSLAFDEIIEDFKIKSRQNAILNVKYNGSDAQSQIKLFLDCLVGRPATKLEINVMLHFIWQVKRKMSGQSVHRHLMPIIYSPKQQIGKSKAVERLLAPISDYVISTSVSSMTDDRYHFKFQDAFVAILNEMQGAARVEVESIKRIITEPKLDVRRLGTNDVIKINQNCTFIGTSNRHISELIFDGEMRRFYQIETADSFSHDIINSVNYQQLWKGVDENLTKGYIDESWAELAELQKEYAQDDYHLQFAKEFDLFLPKPDCEFSFVSVSTVYRAYSEWCVETGNRALSVSWMGVKLKSIGQFPIIKRNEHGKSTTYYKVSPSTKLEISIPKGFAKINNRKMELVQD